MKTYLQPDTLLLSCLCAGLLYFTPTQAQSCGSSAGPFTATSFTTASLGGSFSWSNPSYAQSNDGNYATGSYTLGILASVSSDYLVIRNFGFAIPASATICEIVVEIDRSATGLGIGTSVTDNSIRLVKNGTPTGSSQANTGAAWPGSDAVAYYGNTPATGLWGTSWTAAEVNDPNFGVAISATMNSGLASVAMSARIDQVRITIIYDNTTLGIQLLQYSVNKISGGNQVSWTAVSSTAGGERFTIQRSGDSHAWQDLATIPASNASPTAETPYSFTDRTPAPGPNYYRLKLQNAAGQSSVSPTSLIMESIKDNGIRCWPNPFYDNIHLSTVASLKRLVLKDVQGRVVQVKPIDPGVHDYTLSVPGLPPGIYFLQADDTIFKLLKSER